MEVMCGGVKPFFKLEVRSLMYCTLQYTLARPYTMSKVRRKSVDLAVDIKFLFRVVGDIDLHHVHYCAVQS
jgi:hypothetical protein